MSTQEYPPIPKQSDLATQGSLSTEDTGREIMVLRWMQEETVELERSFFVLSPRNASSLPLLTQLQIWF